jgi:hypothetical protein
METGSRPSLATRKLITQIKDQPAHPLLTFPGFFFLSYNHSRLFGLRVL